MTVTVEFEEVAHFIRVPVHLGEQFVARFLIDSGIGVTVVAPSVADGMDAAHTGDMFSGRRMSGQEVTAPLIRLPEVQLGAFVAHDVLVAVAELGPTGGDEGFDGILGLDLFADAALSIDPWKRMITISEVFDVDASATVVPVDVQMVGPSVCVFVDLVLPSDRVAKVEVDTGSSCLILDSRFMADCGVQPDGEVETITDTDETGYAYIRRFSQIGGRVQLADAPATIQDGPRVMFQDIVHDGLLGTEFLDRFVHTFDMPNSRLILEAP